MTASKADAFAVSSLSTCSLASLPLAGESRKATILFVRRAFWIKLGQLCKARGGAAGRTLVFLLKVLPPTAPALGFYGRALWLVEDLTFHTWRVGVVARNEQKPVVLGRRGEEILKAMRFYRYMTALDVCHLMYSPAALTWARSVLAELCGGADFVENQYLYRFRLPEITLNQKVYTLGSRGRNFLESELGISSPWYFRPGKARQLSYGQMMHSLVLTRFLVAVHRWAAQSQGRLRIAEARIGYDLAGASGGIPTGEGDKRKALPVIPDAWILLEQGGPENEVSFPIFLEIDRGTMYRQRFKKHVGSRIEFIRSGGYERLFGMKAVMMLYATTGEREEYRETRVRALRAWTREVLEEMGLAAWAGIFRFCSVLFGEMYKNMPFDKRVWYRPDEERPVMLLEE